MPETPEDPSRDQSPDDQPVEPQDTASSGNPEPGGADAPRSSADATGVPESPEAVPAAEAAEDPDLSLDERLQAADEAERIEEAHEGEAERSPTRARVPDGEATSPAAVGTPNESGRGGEPPTAAPAIPGADLVPDIVGEGEDPLARALAGEEVDPTSLDQVPAADAATDEAVVDEPAAVPAPSIDLTAGAQYNATGKRKTAVARVILRPGTGAYTVNGKTLDEFFPRATLQRTIRQPLETVGYETRMDVIALMHGGGVSSQAGALRHGVSRALLDADPNLRAELKRRGFLTRDARAKERKKAGLKKARKRPQFSKR